MAAIVGSMFAGMVADFNGGGTDPPHVNISSVLGDRVERWDLLVVVAIATAIGLLAPILRAPRALLGGALVACGVGAIGMWPRFFGLPLIENSSVASPGYGGFIGVAGAVIILFAGRAALRASRAFAGRRPCVLSPGAGQRHDEAVPEPRLTRLETCRPLRVSDPQGEMREQ